MASAAGFSSQIDPLLLQTIQQLPKQDFEEEYLVSCLLMVFVAVSVPKLARSESSTYRVSTR
jgi:NCK-associated protein 1